MKMSANATEAKQLTGRQQKSARGWRYGKRGRKQTGGHGSTTCFTSAGMVQNPVWFQQNLKKEKKKERRKKEKAPGETCDRYFLLSEKVLLSLLSSSRLLTLSRFIYVGFSLCKRRGSGSDAGSHPLLGYVQPHGVSEGNTGSVALCLSK